MRNQDDDFNARVKRVRVQSRQYAPMPDRVGEDDSDMWLMSGVILRPQLALILGAVAMIAGRAISMNQFMIAPSTELLGLGEGAIVIVLLFVIGLLFGKSDLISHGALVVGASLAFLGESFYIPLIPDLMESIYNPDYVALVFFNSR